MLTLALSDLTEIPTLPIDYIEIKEHVANEERGSTMDTTWMSEGKCREVDPELFFPSDGVGVIRARKICAQCTVSTQCLEYALSNQVEHGVWGGTSERERRRLQRTRRGSAITVAAK